MARGRRLSTGPPWERSQGRGKTAGLGTCEGTSGLAPQSSAVWLVGAWSSLFGSVVETSSLLALKAGSSTECLTSCVTVPVI